VVGGAGVAGRGEAAAAATARVVVVDAGIGNLGNVARALGAVGAVAEVTREAEVVAGARCLVLPGVGAFAAAREGVVGELEAALRGALAEGAWLLGLCVGYQLLFEAGEEDGVTEGLGLLPGRVTRLPDGAPWPQIGWNRLHGVVQGEGAAGFMDGVGEGAWVYFVHGYAPEGVPDEVVLARATHGRTFPAAAGRGRVMGTQFHPERSGAVGLRLLANFVAMAHGESRGACDRAAAVVAGVGEDSR